MTTELAEALRRRDPAAFTHLLAVHGSMLYRLARRLTGRADDAEDVVQECLVTAYSKIDKLEDPAALGGWLRRIAVNAALMRIRSRGREPVPMPYGPQFTPDGRHARVIAGWALPPEDAVLRREAVAVLRAAVDRLPDGARLVYVLTEIEGLSYADTAELLDVSEGAVRVRLHRARLALRQTLADYFAEWHDPPSDPGDSTAKETAP